jgi:hypothetical protein
MQQISRGKFDRLSARPPDLPAPAFDGYGLAAVVILRGWMEFREQAAALEQRNLHKQNCANEEDSPA